MAAEQQPQEEKMFSKTEKARIADDGDATTPEKQPEVSHLKSVLAQKEAEWQATVEEYKRILRKYC